MVREIQIVYRTRLCISIQFQIGFVLFCFFFVKTVYFVLYFISFHLVNEFGGGELSLGKKRVKLPGEPTVCPVRPYRRLVVGRGVTTATRCQA